MVHDDGKDMLLITQSIEPHAQERALSQIERPAREFLGQTTGLFQAFSRGQMPQISLFQGEIDLGQDTLDGAVVALLEDGAQAGVTGDDGVETAGECVSMERPAQMHGRGHVVEPIVRLEAGQKPQALLGEGKGDKIQIRQVGNHRSRGGGRKVIGRR